MKKIILSSLIAITGLLAGAEVAFAANAIVSVSPSSASSTIAVPFNVLVQVNPTGNNVCVVKGTIKFENLLCQSITLSDGLMVQTVPTCTSPNFTVGIPKCSSSIQNLFSVSVKGSSAGSGNLSLVGVKVIGAGTDVAFNTSAGVYDVTTVVVPKVATTTIATSSVPLVVPEIIKPVTNSSSTSTGLEVPSGVGQLNPIQVENVSTTTSTSSSATSSVSTTTEKTNGFIATAFEGFSNIPNKLILVLTLIVSIIIGTLVYYNKRNNVGTTTPDQTLK